MRIHILGICGTFMGGLAMLARSLGHDVTGSDANVYPPMSTLLENRGIDLIQGYDPAQLDPAPDLVIIGNAMTRGNPCVEAVLERGIPYVSGPQWLHDAVLRDRWVLAVAGTHGKTTTAGMATDPRGLRLPARLRHRRRARQLRRFGSPRRQPVLCDRGRRV